MEISSVHRKNKSPGTTQLKNFCQKILESLLQTEEYPKICTIHVSQHSTVETADFLYKSAASYSCTVVPGMLQSANNANKIAVQQVHRQSQ